MERRALDEEMSDVVSDGALWGFTVLRLGILGLRALVAEAWDFQHVENPKGRALCLRRLVHVASTAIFHRFTMQKRTQANACLQTKLQVHFIKAQE